MAGFEWVSQSLDHWTIEEVRTALDLGQAEFGRWIGVSRSAVQRAEAAEHVPDPIAVAQGEPLPSWSFRVGPRRHVLVWVLLAIEDENQENQWSARPTDESRRYRISDALRRLRMLRVTAESIDAELVPEAWALALRMAVQADTWIPLRQVTLRR